MEACSREKMDKGNCSVGLRTCCADRKKLGLEGKNPIGAADLEWIFVCNCEGTEPMSLS